MLGKIVAIEGGDGAGKRTTSFAVADQLRGRGLKAAVISFPRYGETVGANVIGDYLAQRLTLAMSPRTLAVYYAIDRFESLEWIHRSQEENDFVIMDRYVGSNVAYQGSKVVASDALACMRWIERLELEQFGVPAPNLSILLRMPVAQAKRLVSMKSTRSYTESVFDLHEADDELQRKIYESYSVLVRESIVSAWMVVEPVVGEVLREPGDIACEIVSALCS
ncbi:hypothetical protein ACQR10_03620 [Bradyrhizobium sp. HKCCYLRH2060]|nr:hypothetical protein [Bradyrhizobium sp. SZCCHNR3003]